MSGLLLVAALIGGLWWLSWEFERQARRHLERRAAARMREWREAKREEGDA